MGTNLSQVFVSDALTALSGTVFNTSGDAADDVGVWKLDPTAGYVSSKLYATTVAETDTAGEVAGTAIKSPLWLVNNIQIVQRGTPHFIASPLINTRNIRSIKYSNHTTFVGTKATITDAKLGAVASGAFQGNLKFIIKSTPTDQLNFYDQGGLNIFGDFPLGAFNTTNHKAINVTVNFNAVDAVDASGDITSDIVDRMAEHPILSKLFKAPAISTADIVIEAIHPGVVFDVIVTNVDDDVSVDLAITGQVLGVGNDWQVIGEEVRCRSRYGNFNRMYFPDNVATYGQVGSKYDKITIEYATNWPSSTGIAPAGELNQAVIYYTAAGTDPSTTASEFATIFGYTQGTDDQFIW